MGHDRADANRDALVVALREAVDLSAALPAFAGLANRITGADICLISLFDDIHGQLRCVEILFPAEMEHLRTAYLRFVYPRDSDNFRVFSSRTPLDVHAGRDEVCSASAQLAFEHWSARHMVILPLTRPDHAVCAGTITLLSRGDDISAAALERLQMAIADSFMLLHLHMQAEVWRERVDGLRNAEAEIDGMLKFVARTSNLVEVDAIYQAVLKEFLVRFDMDIGGLWMVEESSLRCVATEARATVPEWVDSWRRACTELVFDCASARDAVISYVYHTGQPMMFGDVQAIANHSMPIHDKFFLSGLDGLQTLFLQPIRRQGGTNGVLLLFSLTRKQAISPRHQEQIGYWADFLGATLDSALTYAMLQSRSLELGQRNEELAATLTTLSETHEALVQSKKLSALGSIVVAVAHELNTPIGNALTVNTSLEARNQEFAEIIRAGLRRSVLENFLNETNRATGLVTRNLVRAARIIDDFKEIAVDRNHMTRRQFDARRDIEEIVRHVQIDWKGKPVAIALDFQGDTLCDSYHGPFCQVVNNLIANAFRHAFEERQHNQLTVTLSEAEPDTLCLTVADNGNGLPATHLERVFDPFFVGGLRQGSGLGLFIVYNLVTAILGGRIEVQSEVGQGSCFSVWFPKQAPGTPGESP